MGFSEGLVECGGLQRELAVDLGQGVPGDCPGVCENHDIHVVSMEYQWELMGGVEGFGWGLVELGIDLEQGVPGECPDLWISWSSRC